MNNEYTVLDMDDNNMDRPVYNKKMKRKMYYDDSDSDYDSDDEENNENNSMYEYIYKFIVIILLLGILYLVYKLKKDLMNIYEEV